MIKLSKSQEMLDLLKAIGVSSSEITIEPDCIDVNLNSQQMLYRIGASYVKIHHVYDITRSWDELLVKFNLKQILGNG